MIDMWMQAPIDIPNLEVSVQFLYKFFIFIPTSSVVALAAV